MTVIVIAIGTGEAMPCCTRFAWVLMDHPVSRLVTPPSIGNIANVYGNPDDDIKPTVKLHQLAGG